MFHGRSPKHFSDGILIIGISIYFSYRGTFKTLLLLLKSSLCSTKKKEVVLIMKKAVVFIADGSEEIETLTPVDYLRRAGVEVSLVSVGTAGRTVGMAHGVSVNADVTLETYLSDSGNALPDAVVIPGGMPGASPKIPHAAQAAARLILLIV
jgi:hypothetical protein